MKPSADGGFADPIRYTQSDQIEAGVSISAMGRDFKWSTGKSIIMKYMAETQAGPSEEREQLLEWARAAMTMPWEHEVLDAVAESLGMRVPALRDLLAEKGGDTDA